MKSIRRERWKTSMERRRVKSFKPMLLFLEHSRAFEFEIARLHHVLANKQDAGFMIKLDAEVAVPFSAKINAAFGQLDVKFVRALSGADRLADLGGSGKPLGQGTRTGQRYLHSAL